MPCMDCQAGGTHETNAQTSIEGASKVTGGPRNSRLQAAQRTAHRSCDSIRLCIVQPGSGAAIQHVRFLVAQPAQHAPHSASIACHVVRYTASAECVALRAPWACHDDRHTIRHAGAAQSSFNCGGLARRSICLQKVVHLQSACACGSCACHVSGNMRAQHQVHSQLDQIGSVDIAGFAPRA